MKKKFRRFLFSCVAIVIPVILLFALLYRMGYLPLLTNSISFDAKINYIERKNVKQIDLMAIGSSITLNDLSSKVLTDSLGSSYFNFSCWGLQIGDTKRLLINYLPKYKPKCVIICSSTPDFTTSGNLESINNYLNAGDYFKNHFKPFFYLKNYNSVLDIITRKRELEKHKSTNNDYASLAFDSHGSVLLNIDRNNILPERWNEVGGFPTPYTNNQYKELASLGQLLKQNHVQLIFIQTPIKKDYVKTTEANNLVEAHFNKCKSIVENYGGVYLNFHDTNMFHDDRMFVDQFHLSAHGAILFSKEAAHGIKVARESARSR